MKTPMKSPKRHGSFLLVAALMAFALTTIVASFITLSTTAVKTTEANFTYHATLNPGEDAVDVAFATLRRYVEILSNGTEILQPGSQSAADAVFTANGWTTTPTLPTAGSTFTATRLINGGQDIALGNHRTAGNVRVTIRNVPRASVIPSPTRPDILAEVTYVPKSAQFGSGYTRQFYAQIGFDSSTGAAMLARNLLNLNGKVSVDSFDAKLGTPTGNPGPSTPFSRDNAVVACTDTATIAGGSALIYGYASTQSLIKDDIIFKGSAHVWGDYLNQGTGGTAGNIVQDAYPGWDADGGTLLNQGVDSHRLTSGFTVDPSLEANQKYNKSNLSNENEPQSDDIPIINPVPKADPDGVMTLTLDATDPTTGKNIGGYYILPPAGLTVGSGAPQQRLSVKGAVKIIASDTGADARLAGSTGVENETGTSAATLPQITVKAGGEIHIPKSGIATDGSAVRNTLAIYSAGNIDTSGGAVVNDAVLDSVTGEKSSATAFTIYGTNTNSGTNNKQAQSIVMGGASNNVVRIRAPYANVTITGTKGTMMGAVLAFNITLDGSIAFHYDEALANQGRVIPELRNWLELKGADKVDFSAFK